MLRDKIKYASVSKTADGLKNITIPRIGMRIIKSGIAAILCFAAAFFRGDNGIVFYSLLSALWCMQGYRANTMKNAL